MMRRLLDLALWAALAISIAAAVYAGSVIYTLRQDAQTILRLQDGNDVSVEAETAGPEVLLARALFLVQRDRLDDAQSLLDSARNAPAEAQADLNYVVASARLRQAVSEIERGQIDKGIAQVGLAKTHLRQTLRIGPDWWDAKHNLDVAMRLVRDFPQADGVEEEEEGKPKRLWTDLPGVPRGLP